MLGLFAAAMLAPAAVALSYGELRATYIFLATAAVTVFFGIGMVFATQGTTRRHGRRSDLLLAIVSWPVLAAFGAAPFFLLDSAATPVDAFFEALSGLTTTGATVLVGLDSLGRGLLFWRAWLQWLGGFGTIILMVSVLPMLGVGGMQIFVSAMPYGDHATLGARLKRLALTLASLYGGLTILCAFALWVAGMSGFDAVAHALSTVSTGGFSTHDAGIGGFDNPAIEGVLMVFMLAGAVNITLYWALLHGRFRAFIADPEFRPLLLTVLFATVAAAYLLVREGDTSYLDALRHGAFVAVSALTTTGFVNESPVAWPAAVSILLLALIFIGGSSGSTAGGIKIMRARLALAQGRRELARLSQPHAVVGVRYGAGMVTEPALQALSSFFILFSAAFGALAIALAALGLDAVDAVSTALAILANAGAGLPLVSGAETTYAMLPQALKWVLCLGMLVGRLEVVAVVALFAPMYWKR